MRLEQIKDSIKELDDSELSDLLFWLPTEESRRKDKKKKDEATAKVIEELRDAGEISTPTNFTAEDITDSTKPRDIDEWVNPGTIHSKMYTQGQVVRHNGKIWKSTTPVLNSWEPGSEGVYENVWAEVNLPVSGDENVDKDEKPTGSGYEEWTVGKSYKTGDIFSLNGVLYKVQQPTVAQAHFRPDAPGMTALYVRIK